MITWNKSNLIRGTRFRWNWKSEEIVGSLWWDAVLALCEYLNMLVGILNFLC